MTYVDVVLIITNVLNTILALLTFHFMVFAVIGIFFYKSFPKSKEKLKYGLIIPARNEESVVCGLIDSIKKNNYPADKLTIFLISHNSTDNTAQVARDAGVCVYEYNNPEENTMGYAFRYLFKCIDRDFGLNSFDGFFIFNADNILDKDFITNMNDAFCYYDKQSVITSFSNSKNFGANLISGLYGMYFTVGCRLESRGRTVLGCSTRVQGTGYLIPVSIVENGWKYVSLAEDWEFTADRILLDNTIKYCDRAMFYDEQPTSIPIMWRQRVRWSKGHLIVFCTRIKELVTSLFKKGCKHRFSRYDISVNCLPITLLISGIYILELLLLFLTPFFFKDFSFLDLGFLLLDKWFIGQSVDVFNHTGLVIAWIESFLGSTICLMASAVIIFIVERKRIKDVSFINKVLIILLWPLFIYIQFPIDVHALLAKNLTWKPIPHSDQTSFDEVNASEKKEDLVNAK